MYQYWGDIRLYDFFGSLVIYVVIIFNLTQLKKKKAFLGNVSNFYIDLSKKHGNGRIAAFFSNKTFWAVIETLIISFFQIYFVGLLNSFFGENVGTGANYFGLLFITPLILFVICHLLGIDIVKQYDLITPAFPLALIFVKLACFCQGCCWGVEWEHGLYNHRTGNVEFPVQLVEMFLALLIFIFLMFYRKKAKPGTMYPVYMITYSATRFFSEFFRREENVFGPLKTYQLLCIAGVVIGIVELLLANKYHEDISEYFRIKLSPFTKIKNRLLKEKNIIHHKNRKK